MGLEVDDFERGNDCPACHAPGETPKYMHIIFEGSAHDGLYLLEQTVRCEWQYWIPAINFKVHYWSSPVQSGIKCNLGAVDWFLANGPICKLEFDEAFGHGSCHLWWGTHEGVAAMVGSGYLWSMDGTKYEPYFFGDNKWTFRLANKRVPSNILVSYQP